MIHHIQHITNKTNNFNYQHSQNIKNKTEGNISIKPLLGAMAGTFIPLALIMRQKKIINPLKMKYCLQDMLLLSGTSVAGGVLGGIADIQNKTQTKNKIKEGVFQFLNASIPTWIIGGVLKLPESSHKFNNPFIKIVSVFAGLIVGMLGAAQVSNLIFDPKDVEPDRKLSIKDCLINADDVLGALTLAKLPLIQKLHFDKILPAVYTYCGYTAGKTN